MIRDLSREGLKNLNVRWIRKMIKSTTPALEKINLFWHHHFACEINNPVFARSFSNTIRTHSLGNFRDLLLGIAQSAAMIAYLNLRQNKKQSPNEDFARELCELFCLGIDQEYSEKDIKEIARAFTGWGHDQKGDFLFRKRLHDFGPKIIFGKKGDHNGEDVIDLILEKRTCAVFIAQNVFEYFVNPVTNTDHINELADVLYNAGYELKPMFEHLVESDWFYAEQNIMCKIKSPLELIIGLSRPFQLDTNQDEAWIIYQKVMNQILYRPPNVAGWKVDREWINSNSMALRLRLPSIILSDGYIDLDLKPALDEVSMNNKPQKGLNLLKSFSPDWAYFFRENNVDQLTELFFNSTLSPQAKKTIHKNQADSNEEKVIQMLSLPEYQLC
jgi:uncharacterized protein (DUF1800 family)